MCSNFSESSQNLSDPERRADFDGSAEMSLAVLGYTYPFCI